MREIIASPINCEHGHPVNDAHLALLLVVHAY